MKKAANKGEVRIIGGKCRGRKIQFLQHEGLRPTPNRVRETLFNWLALYIQGANCLDLFAGSGALSFEAKSRGAAYCLMFDSSAEIIRCLAENIKLLELEGINAVQATFPYETDLLTRKFDIVFVDPPFHKGYIRQSFEWLLQSQCLNQNALIYVESESDENAIMLPEKWVLLKDKKAGHVRYSLIQANLDN